ncbi:alpha/beta hydrolase [Bradyrhizobium sp. WYCCWR 13023]|uniref:Alpha/beta hydrolase n=1 Tax=Bradyrhizobium zhengyangense TaxID=2911009 RepID=A0A9X1R788_9BRAD|nr:MULTISPECIES: alpha/beta hydrolase [Bradyrhizobium]MCG2626285.1 alpha/beta hydrolase [Bradyrhizobium zhengyangense]MCG2644703.1 alpha/beta hydrolase [Bradyrhizobium zhengyangense]MCG2668293.1 alpha/beta hydrolase [Bradyrhizobium zhengyangense]
MSNPSSFTERMIPGSAGRLYTRDYPGEGPPFVLMHGFPDHLGIYDQLVPELTAAGRRVVTFDFLGFGKSDRPDGAQYTFEGQLQDLAAVVTALGVSTCVPVAHDSSGPAGINYALAFPEKVASLVILNSGYDDDFPVLWPEMVTLFATPGLAALASAIANDPAQFGWLLNWQQDEFMAAQPIEQRNAFKSSVGQLIADNFMKQPSGGPAFVQLASHFLAELHRNTQHLPELKRFDFPVKVIWGDFDPYMTTSVGRNRASHFKNAKLSPLPGGHWLQADIPDLVAKEMLS